MPFSGNINRQGTFNRSLSGQANFNGSTTVISRFFCSLYGTLENFAGVLSRKGIFIRNLAGVLNFLGIVTKKGIFKKSINGSINFTGNFTRICHFYRALIGAITFNGAISTGVLFVSIYGTIGALAGSMTKRVSFKRSLTGELYSSGEISKKGFFKRTFTGILNLNGGIKNTFFVALNRTMTIFAGAVSAALNPITSGIWATNPWTKNPWTKNPFKKK